MIACRRLDMPLSVILLNAFNCMAAEEKRITGFEFEDPWNEIAAVWHVGAFVDDTNQGVTDSNKGTQSQAELVETLRQAGQMWENLLHISGGALNLSKCLWSLQFWEWHKRCPRLQQMSKDDPHLVMTSAVPALTIVSSVRMTMIRLLKDLENT